MNELNLHLARAGRRRVGQLAQVQYFRAAEGFGHDRFHRRSLPPVVEDIKPGLAVAGLVWAMHRHDVHPCAKTPGEHRPVRLFARRVDAGQHVLHAGRQGAGGAGIEQGGKPMLSAGTRPHGAELDEETTRAGFARRPPMADGKPGEAAVRFPHQHRVTETARRRRPDFTAQIEAVINLLGQRARRRLGARRCSGGSAI